MILVIGFSYLHSIATFFLLVDTWLFVNMAEEPQASDSTYKRASTGSSNTRAWVRISPMIKCELSFLQFEIMWNPVDIYSNPELNASCNATAVLNLDTFICLANGFSRDFLFLFAIWLHFGFLYFYTPCYFAGLAFWFVKAVKELSGKKIGKEDRRPRYLLYFDFISGFNNHNYSWIQIK